MKATSAAKEVVIACLKVTFQHFPAVAETTNGNP
jgi:hypothetical protein